MIGFFLGSECDLLRTVCMSSILLAKDRLFVCSVGLCIHRFVHLLVCAFASLCICRLVHLSVCPLIDLCIYRFVHLSNCPFVHLSNCPFVRLSNCPLVGLSNCPLPHLSVCSFVHSPACPFDCHVLINPGTEKYRAPKNTATALSRYTQTSIRGD